MEKISVDFTVRFCDFKLNYESFSLKGFLHVTILSVYKISEMAAKV